MNVDPEALVALVDRASRQEAQLRSVVDHLGRGRQGIARRCRRAQRSTEEANFIIARCASGSRTHRDHTARRVLGIEEQRVKVVSDTRRKDDFRRGRGERDSGGR